MHVLILAVIAIAAVYALRGGGRGLKRAYTSRRDAYKADHPDAGRATRAAHGVGHAASVVRYGPTAVARGAKEGWKEGWGKGLAWRDQYPPLRQPQPSLRERDAELLRERDAQASPATATGRAPVPAPSPNGSPAPSPAPSPNPAPDPAGANPEPTTPAPAGAAQPTQRSEPMAHPPATGSGEVASPEQLHAELAALVAAVGAEVDDAIAGQGRAESETSRTQNLVTSSVSVKLPAAHQAMINRLTQPAAQRLAAARERVAADTEVLAQSKDAVAMAAKHVQLVGDAAGEFYNPNGSTAAAPAAGA